ncbi:MAG: hypothetical protein H6844_06280 [Alphaproteobacteria bacterium]|nr:hypothetical protein [Alphaproteobacteria bacterium]
MRDAGYSASYVAEDAPASESGLEPTGGSDASASGLRSSAPGSSALEVSVAGNSELEQPTDLDGDGGNETGASPGLTMKRMSSADPDATFRGVAVTANAKDDVETYAIGAGVGGNAAVFVGAAVNVITSNTHGYIGDDTNINQHMGATPNANQTVLVSAASDFSHVGVGVGVAISGNAAVAPGVDVSAIDLHTNAWIGDHSTIDAENDVKVLAASEADFVIVSFAVAISGTASVGGGVSVVTLDAETTADIYNFTDIQAGGDVAVMASDHSSMIVVSGAVAAGFGGGGIGAGVGVVIFNKDTRATIGDDTDIDAEGGAGMSNVLLDGVNNDGTFKRGTGHGVIVQADSDETITTIAVAAAGGIYVGVAGAVTVSLIDSDATARIGEGAMINQRNGNYLTNGSVGSDQGVYVGASNDARILEGAGAVGLGLAGIAGAVSFGSIKNDVNASIGTGAHVNAHGDLSVNALANKELQGFTISGSGGLAALAASVSVWSIGEDFSSAYEDNDSENPSEGANNQQDALEDDMGSNNASSTTQSNIDGTNSDIAGELGGLDDNSTDPSVAENSADDRAGKALNGLSLNPVSGSDLNTSLTASAAGPTRGVNAIVEGGVVADVGDDVNVDAYERIKVDIADGSVSVGLVGAGAAVAVLNVASQTRAKLGGTIRADGDISVTAAGIRDFDYHVVTGQGGLAALGAGVTVINDNSLVLAEISDGAVIRDAASLAVTAVTDQDINVINVGIQVGFAAIGVSFSQVNADDGNANTVETLARIGDNADIGLAVGMDDNEVGNITVEANATSDVIVEVYAGAAGVGAGSFNFGFATYSAQTKAEIGNDVQIDSHGQVLVLARDSAKAVAHVLTATAGGLALGVSLARAKTNGDVTARIGNELQSDSEGLAVYALHNQTLNGIGSISLDGGRGAFAMTEAAGGGIFSGQGSIPEAEDKTDVLASIEAGEDGGDIDAGAQQVIVDARGTMYAKAESFAFSLGGVAAGASLVDATAAGSVTAAMNGTVTGGSGATINASAISDAIATAEAATVGLLEITVPHATALSDTDVSASVGADATLIVDQAANISATSDANADASGFAAGGGLIGIGSMNAHATVRPSVSAFVGSDATVAAASLSVAASHNMGVAGSRNARAEAEAAKGAGLSFQFTTAIAESTATVDSYVGGGAMITTGSTLSISAVGVNNADSDVDNVTIGILVSVGEGDSLAVANGSSSAGIKDSGALSATPKISVGELNITATTTDTANAQTTAATGGFVAAGGNQAVAYADAVEDSAGWKPLENDDGSFTPDPNYVSADAYIGNNSSILVGGNVSVTANARPQADSYVRGSTGGAVDVGGSFSTTRVMPVVNATIESGTVLDAGGSISVDAKALEQDGTVPDYFITNVSTGNDTANVAAHGLETGQIVEYESNTNGDPIGGLDEFVTEEVADANDNVTTQEFNRQYAVIAVDADTLAFGAELDDATVDPNTEIIEFQSEHGFRSGDQVVYRVYSGSPMPGLTDGATYYVLVIDGTHIKLVASEATAEDPDSVFAGKDFLPSDVDTGTEANTISGFTHGFLNDQPVTYNAPDPFTFTDRQVDVDPNATISGGYIDRTTIDNDTIRFAITEGTNEGKPFNHGFSNGDIVRYNVEFVDDSTDAYTDPGATAIGGLQAGEDYRVVVVSNSAIQLKRSSLISENVYYVRDGSGSDQIVRTDGLSWEDDGFVAGIELIITNGGGNDGQYTIQSVNGDTITLASNDDVSEITRVDRSMTVDRVDLGGGDYRLTLTVTGTTWAALGITSGTVELHDLGAYSGMTGTIDNVSGGTIRLSIDASGGANIGSTFNTAFVQRTTPRNDTFDSPVIALTPNKGFPFDDLNAANDTLPGNTTDPGNSDIHSLIRVADLPIGNLVDGQTYYVDYVSSTEFGLTATPLGARIDLMPTALTGVLTHSIGALAVDISAGGASHDLRINITSFTAGDRLLGPGGVPLNLFAPQSGDGISSSTAKGSSGAIVGVKQNEALLRWSPTAVASVNGDLIRAGTNVTITSDAGLHSTATTTNGSGGFVAVGNVDARTNSTLTSLAEIGANTRLIAGDNLTVDANADATADSAASSSTGGFVGVADADSRVNVDYNVDAKVGDNAVVLVGKLASILAAGGVIGTSSATGRGVGFGGDAEAYSEYVTDSAKADATVGSGAKLEALEVILSSTVGDTASGQDARAVNISATTDARAGGFYSEATADSITKYIADNTVAIKGNAEVTGFEGVDLIATFDDVRTHAKAYTRSTGLFGYVSSDATNEQDLTNFIDGDSGALVTAGPRIELPNTDSETTELAQFDNAKFRLALYGTTENGTNLTYSNDASHSKRSLAAGGSDEHGDPDYVDSMDFDSDVLILSGRSPELDVVRELVIGSGGNIVKAVNVTVDDSPGGGSATKTSGTTLSDHIIVNDITNPGPGDVAFDSADIDGSGGTWTFRESLERVRITNESDLDIEINNIDVMAEDRPLVWLRPSGSVPLTFTINAEVAPTLVEIFNTGDSDIIIDGTINNPVGTTTIVNTGGMGGGSVLSGKDRGVSSPDGRYALIVTNILNVDATNDVGSDTERLNVDLVSSDDVPQALTFTTGQVSGLTEKIFIGQNGKFYDGQLVRYTSASPLGGLANNGLYYVKLGADGNSLSLSATPGGSDIDLTPSGSLSQTHSLTSVEVFTVDAVDNIDLDLRALKREGTNVGEYIVNIDRIAAGNTADVLLRNSLYQTGTGTRGGIDVEWPSESPTAGNYVYFFQPDMGFNQFLGPVRGAFATGSTVVDVTTYDFRGIDPQTDARELAGLQSGGVSYPGNPAAANGDIIVQAASLTVGDPTINVLALTEVANPNAADYENGEITVITDGYIALTEITDHMRVGEIRSTGSDVLLYSPQSIFDANDDFDTAPADVAGVNITMVAASGDVGDPGFVNPDPGDVAGEILNPTRVWSGLSGGIGTDDNFLEINGDILGTNTGVLRIYDDLDASTLGIYLDETTGDMRIDTIWSLGDVALRTTDGSVIDARDDDLTNVYGQSIDIDANGTGANIGEDGDDLEIDSRRGSAAVDLTQIGDDVALEAIDNIWLTETAEELRLVFAHTYDGLIRLTVNESADPTSTGEDLELIQNGSARFAEDNGVIPPGDHVDADRIFAHGMIYAEQGSVELRVADDVTLDDNSQIVAGLGIIVRGDFADADLHFGTEMVLRGMIVAGAMLTTAGSRNGGIPVGVSTPDLSAAPAPGEAGYEDRLTQIFGGSDIDFFQFGDETGAAGTTTWGEDGYIFLGSKTRVYGSADADTGVYDNPGAMPAFVDMNDGEDHFTVFYLQDTATQTSPQTADVVAEHTLTLDGQADTDYYAVHTLGSNGEDQRNYIINVLDTGEEFDGVDELTIFGLDNTDPDANGSDLVDGSFVRKPTDDIFLLRAASYLPHEIADRPGYVALLHGELDPYQDVIFGNEPSNEVQRINYDTGLNGRLIVEGGGGNDAFFSDDATVTTTLDGGLGDDQFQVGQIFGEKRNVEDGNLLDQDVFPDLVATTRGWLSQGISAPMVVQGGTGNDEFRVYSNQAELRLEGDDDNDLFIVRAFALAATVDFDWNNDGSIDALDLDDGVAVLNELQSLADATNSDQAITDLSLASLLGTPEADATYRQYLRDNLPTDGGPTNYRFDVNDDLNINYLDLLLTPNDVTDDEIVLDQDGVAVPQIGLGFSIAQAPDIRAGGGQDEVRYNVNAPVSVEGGTGFDKLVILGTEFPDDIAITKDGIFGAGLNVRYSTIEVVEVDGLEGDDEFFIQSTAFGVAYRVIGGLGSDTINVAGDVTEDIVTRELEGVSGAVNHIVGSEDDPLYDGLPIDGFNYNVTTDGEGLVVIDEGTDGFTAVREGDAVREVDSYTVKLAKPLAAGEVVYVTVSAARSPEEERNDTLMNPAPLPNGPGDTIWLSTVAPGDPVTPSDFQHLEPYDANGNGMIDADELLVENRAVVLRFDHTNFGTAQTVWLYAVDDTRAEGDRVVVVQHSVISNVADYDAIDVRNVEVEVRDNDTPGVYVTEVDAMGNEDGRTLVVEGDAITRLSDQIQVSLASQPAGTVVVDIVLNDFADKAIELVNTDMNPDLDILVGAARQDLGDGRIVVARATFDAGSYATPITVGIEARDDFVREDPQTAVVEFVRNDAETTDANYVFPNLRSDPGLLDVEVIDNETAGAVVLQEGGETVLIPDDLTTTGVGEDESNTQDYTIRLTKQPTSDPDVPGSPADVDVAIVTDGLADVVQINGIDATYQTIGGERASQRFTGSIVFEEVGGKLTLTRGTGADFGSFVSDGWKDGDLLRIVGTAGGAVDVDGDYTVETVSEQTITLTTTNANATGQPAFEVMDDVVLSLLIEEDIWTGYVKHENVLDEQLSHEAGMDVFVDRITRVDAGGALFADTVKGWLDQGFLEGQRVRITNLDNPAQYIDAKIAIIRGENDTLDETIQFTLDPDTDVHTHAAWLEDATNLHVEVNRLAVVASFDETNWYQQQTVTLKADPYYEVPSTREGVKVFAVQPHRLSNLRGPLAVEGGPTGADRSLTNGVKLPGERDDFLIAIGAQPPESQQIDVLNIFNDGSQADTNGVLTSTTLRGFGMAEDLVFPNVSGPLYGEGADSNEPTDLLYPGGISFGKVNFGSGGVSTEGLTSTVEVVNVMLGEGNDRLDVEGTLNPADFVSAENTFTFTNSWDGTSDPNFGLVADWAGYAGENIITRAGFDWKAQGFLAGQTVTIEGMDGLEWTVLGVEDAIEYFDPMTGDPIINPATSEPYRDPNDNSILILSGPDFSFEGMSPGDIKIVAEDLKVLETVTATVGAGVLTRSTGNWEDSGFIAGQLLHVETEAGSHQFRIVSISDDGTTMEVNDGDLDALGAPGETVTGIFWVQGPHGGLTVLHGGGNLDVDTIGTFNLAQNGAGETLLTRLDGRSFGTVDDGMGGEIFGDARFQVGQLIQLGDETHVRQILEIRDADPDDFGIANPFSTWGRASVLVLSDPVAGEGGDTVLSVGAMPADGMDHAIRVSLATPDVTEVTVAEVDIRVDRLIAPDGTNWETDYGFEVGQFIEIDGQPGQFLIADITGNVLRIANAALDPCDDGTVTVRLTRTDITRTGGASVGGDHFVVTGGAGPDSPLVIYGDTSQDGVWYSGHSGDQLGIEFGEKPFDPFADLPDNELEDDEWVFPVAVPFGQYGNDIIDASALFADAIYDADGIPHDAEGNVISVGLTAYGGAGNDLIIGSQVGDHLAGGSGNDTIIGQRGVDHIYGDSGVNVNIFTRALDIAVIDASPAPSADPNTPETGSTFAPVASPVRDDLTAGKDTLIGNGGAPDNNPDIIFGDHGIVTQDTFDPNLPDVFAAPGEIVLQKIQTTLLDSILSISSTELDNGADDILIGAEIDDVMIGGGGNDIIDGGIGDDLIFGDAVTLTRMGGADDNLLDDIRSLRFQTLAGTLMYSRSDRETPAGYDEAGADTSGVLLVSLDSMGNPIPRDYRDPNGPQWWAEYEIDYADTHTSAMDAGLAGVGTFGNDYIAGGQGNDMIFGQLGDDVIQGDGTVQGTILDADEIQAIIEGANLDMDDSNDVTTRRVGAARDPGDATDPIGPLTVIPVDVNATDLTQDGEDYIEGGGGCDVVFGGLGQDDLVGGSSSFFSLTTPDVRPDHNDVIFGGTGVQIDRNDADPNGDATAAMDPHSRDADVIVGDNGNIVRLVGVNNTDDPSARGGAALYLHFAYDTDAYNADEKIIARGVTLLDYTPGGTDFAPAQAIADIFGDDEVHGETGDDVIYLGAGNDIAFGDAENDDIYGNAGNDWISGGTGIDGILGDDGRIFTSRNEALANGEDYGAAYSESLYGVFKLLARDPDSRTSQGNVIDELVYTPGKVQTALINRSGELLKSVDLTPYSVDPEANLYSNPLLSNPQQADDVIFGGLGDDFLHGGSGDDAIAGGEALPDSYTQLFENGVEVGLVRTDFTRPWNPGDILKFGEDTDPWNAPKPIRSRLGEFYLYDEYDPRRVILFKDNGSVWDANDPQDPTLYKQYFLNQLDNEGETFLGYTGFEPNGTPIGDEVPRESDGNDAIFGDLGNDWIVGGTGRDHIYGGFGNDLLNADDVMGGPGTSYDETAGLNDAPDTHLIWEDRAYGGAGLDILIGNTGGDRLIDWSGEFNSYIVPFAPFGIATVSRQVPPQLFDFLWAQAASDGVDVTRFGDTGQSNSRSRYSNVSESQGDPDGELGLVTQRDHGLWQDQSGPPTDPQAGNIPGGRRDVLRTADFDNRTMDGFSVDRGNFVATGGSLSVAAASPGDVATAVFMLDDYLPQYYEVEATISTDKPTGGWKANGYVIFDYYDDQDFKFAGINISTNKIEMGYVDATGWHYVQQSNKPVQIKPNQNYHVTVAVNGTNVTLQIEGVNWFTYDYTPRYEGGEPVPLNRGMVGVGMDGSRGKFDNFRVQILPPEWTLEATDDFEGTVDEVPNVEQSPTWAELGGVLGGTANGGTPAVQFVELGATLAANSHLELQVDVVANGQAGLIFDSYDDQNYKFVVLDAATNRLVIGHSTTEHGIVQDFSVAVNVGSGSHNLMVGMQGAGMEVRVDGALVSSYGFNAATVDGQFGVIVMQGEAAFDNLRVATDDDAFAEALRLAGGVRDDSVAPTTVSADDVQRLYEQALADWADSGLVSDADLAALADVKLEVVDLEGSTLARAQEDEDVIQVDLNAAGAGWYIDSDPSTTEAFEGVDLITVLRHEIGHLLGYEHNEILLMAAEIDTGVRLAVDDGATGGATATDGATYATDPTFDDGLATDPLKRGKGDKTAAAEGSLIFDPETGQLVDSNEAALLFASRTTGSERDPSMMLAAFGSVAGLAAMKARTHAERARMEAPVEVPGEVIAAAEARRGGGWKHRFLALFGRQ